MRSILVFLISLICSVLHAQKEYNQLDAKGLKHGLWKGVYEESKRPRYQGSQNNHSGHRPSHHTCSTES